MRLELLRKDEIESVGPLFFPGDRVLEIGGGNGFQARVLAEWGCEVESIDLQDREPTPIQYFPVRDYDGRNFPFDEASFDVVYSSNVLEHIRDLDQIFGEIHRVLKPGGLAVHLVPTATWRLWTSLAHYLYLPKRLLAARRPATGEEPVPPVADIVERKGRLYVLRRIVVAGPHGEYPSALRELHYFSRRRWKRVFAAQGFSLDDARGSRLFYTGYALVPHMSIEMRRRLSRFLGSSCHVFVMRTGRT